MPTKPGIPKSYLDTDVALTANSDSKVATQKAIKTYADGSFALTEGTYVVGQSTGCSTLTAAVTTIGSTNAKLVLPSGAHIPPATIPKNIRLAPMPGAYLDTTGFYSGDIETMEAYGTNGVKITTALPHGMATGDKICMYEMTQANWELFNNIPFTITKVDNNSFRFGTTNASAWAAYVPGTDPGKISQITQIGAVIEDTKAKIFNINSPSILFASSVDGAGNPIGPLNVRVRPEWLGAVADYNSNLGTGTDNSTAFDLMSQCFFHLGYTVTKFEILMEGDYYCADTLVARCDSNKQLVYQENGYGTANIISGSSGYPAIEGANLTNCEFNIGIVGHPTNIPSVGLWLGRSDAGATGSKNGGDLRFSGSFQYGALYCINSEENFFKRVTPRITTTEANSFVIANVNSSTYFPLLQPKYTTYDPSLRPADSCLGNRIDILDASHYGSAATNCLYFGQSAPGNIGKIYYGGQVASANVFDLRDGADLMLNGTILVEGVAHVDMFHVESAAGGKVTTIKHILPISGGNVTNFISSDANTTIDNSILLVNGGNTVIAGAFTNSIFSTSSGTVTFGGEISNNDLIYGASVTNVSYYNPTNPNFKRNNRILDLRTNNITSWGRRHLDDLSILVGLNNTGGYGDNAIYYGGIELGGGKTKIAVGQGIPTAGSWNQGDLVIQGGTYTYKSTPIWYCNLRGTFGTLSGVTSTSDGTTVIIVNSVTNLKVGQYITVAGGRAVGARIESINTTTKQVTLNGNCTAGTDIAVSFYGPPTFVPFAPIVQAPYTYTDPGTGTITFNFNNGEWQKCTLGASGRTIALSNPVAGQKYTLQLIQGAGGSMTVNWPAVKWPAATAPTLTTTAAHWDLIELWYDGTVYHGRLLAGDLGG